MRVIAAVAVLCCFVAVAAPCETRAIAWAPTCHASKIGFVRSPKDIPVRDCPIQVEARAAFPGSWIDIFYPHEIIVRNESVANSRNGDYLSWINVRFRPFQIVVFERGQRASQGEFRNADIAHNNYVFSWRLTGIGHHDLRLNETSFVKKCLGIFHQFEAHIGSQLPKCGIFSGFPHFFSGTPQSQSKKSDSDSRQGAQKTVEISSFADDPSNSVIGNIIGGLIFAGGISALLAYIDGCGKKSKSYQVVHSDKIDKRKAQKIDDPSPP